MQLIDGIAVKVLEKRMFPRNWSYKGYLKENDSLLSIIDQDLSILKKLHIKPIDIANKLEYLLKKGSNSSKFWGVRIGHFKINIMHSCTMITCPWAQKQFTRCTIGKGVKYLTTEDFIITNMKTHEKIKSTSLCIHLIRDHNFFCAPNTPYRIDPEQVIRILEL